MAVQVASIQMPPFLIPIHNLMEKTSKVTQIQAIYPALRREMITQNYDIPIPQPMPDKPFRVALPDIYFGKIWVTIDPRNIQTDRRERHNSNSNRLLIQTDYELIPQSESGQSIDLKSGQGIEVENQEVSTAVQSKEPKIELNEILINREIHFCLIYFKCVEGRVRDVLSKCNESQFHAKTYRDLTELRDNLHTLTNDLQIFQNMPELLLERIQENEEYKEIVACIEVISGVLDRLEETKIPETFLKLTIDRKQEHFLCSILGLEDEAAEDLLKISPDMRCHQTDQYWIEQFLDLKQNELEDTMEKEQQFLKLGFNAAKSTLLSGLLANNPYSDHKTTARWAKDHIANCFKYDILLAPYNKEFNEYNKNQKLREDYTIPTNVDEKEEDKVDIPAVDLSSKEDSFNLAEFRKPQANTLKGITHWFHATDRNSALNILQNGIDLQKGKEGGDYSDGNGFYMTSSFDFARAWPQMMRKETAALVIFELEDHNSLLCQEKGGKSFQDADEDWRRIIRYFRNRKDVSEIGKEKRRELKKLKYVFGPISKDGASSRTKNWSPMPRDPLVYELCLKDEDLAEKFYNNGRSIKKVIFFH